MIEGNESGGWALDGVWADDFHHVIRRMVAQDQHSYFADFSGDARELAAVIRQGWLYTGEHSSHLRSPRGTDPGRVPMHRFVVCLQNHDQIGNRAFGDRLHHVIGEAEWRAVSVLLLTVPMTPLLFMGQEWAASTPFQYFTDLETGLGGLVTEGRRREFAEFPEFSSPEAALRIPDPQAETTFLNSRLQWDERTTGVHQRSLALYRALIALRLDHVALTAGETTTGVAAAPDAETIVLKRSGHRETIWMAARFRSGGSVDLNAVSGGMDGNGEVGTFEVLLDTEHAEFAGDPAPIDLDDAIILFQRPGAIILKAR
jgi:maltooligosyltrehalose trehalohydrolase